MGSVTVPQGLRGLSRLSHLAQAPEGTEKPVGTDDREERG